MGLSNTFFASAAEPSLEAQALAMRAMWMRRVGMSEEEITEKCDPTKYPANFHEEVENLLALGIDVQFLE